MKDIALAAKDTYNHSSDSDAVKKQNVIDDIKKKLENMNKKNFTIPIHPSYHAKGFCYKKVDIFGSKMVPIRIAGRSSESNSEDDTKNVFEVIYKCGKVFIYLLYR